MSDEEDIQHTTDLLEIKYRVRNELIKQIAQYAGLPPPHLNIELAQIRKDIKLLQTKLKIVSHSHDAVEAVGGDALAVTVQYRLNEIEDKFDSALHVFADAQARQAEAQAKQAEAQKQAAIAQAAASASAEEWRRNEKEIRKERQQEHDQRMTAVEEQMRTLFDLVTRLGDRFNSIIWKVVIIALVSSAAISLLVFWLTR